MTPGDMLELSAIDPNGLSLWLAEELAIRRNTLLDELDTVPGDEVTKALRRGCENGFGIWQSPDDIDLRNGAAFFAIDFLGALGSGFTADAAAQDWLTAAKAMRT